MDTAPPPAVVASTAVVAATSLHLRLPTMLVIVLTLGFGRAVADLSLIIQDAEF